MLRYLVLVAIVGLAIYAWRIWQRGRRRMEVERAAADFARDRIKLQEDFRAAADVSGKPRGLRCFDYESEQLLWKFDTAPYIWSLLTLDLDSDGAQEIYPAREMFAQGRILLVESVVARDQSENAAGLKGIQGFGHEEVRTADLHRRLAARRRHLRHDGRRHGLRAHRRPGGRGGRRAAPGAAGGDGG